MNYIGDTFYFTFNKQNEIKHFIKDIDYYNFVILGTNLPYKITIFNSWKKSFVKES